jgi:hypothetical protein
LFNLENLGRIFLTNSSLSARIWFLLDLDRVRRRALIILVVVVVVVVDK